MAPRSKRPLTLVNLTTGMSDGLVLPFIVCVVATSFWPEDVARSLLAGTVAALAGALVFGIARARGERQEIQHHHPGLAAQEADEEAALMNAIGIDPVLTQHMQHQMEEERKLWLSEIAENEMDWETYVPGRALRSGLETGSGFLAGGLLVSCIFCFAGSLHEVAAWIMVALLFYLSGWTKGMLVGKNAWYRGAFQLILGLLAGLAALALTWLLGAG